MKWMTISEAKAQEQLLHPAHKPVSLCCVVVQLLVGSVFMAISFAWWYSWIFVALFSGIFILNNVATMRHEDRVVVNGKIYWFHGGFLSLSYSGLNDLAEIRGSEDIKKKIKSLDLSHNELSSLDGIDEFANLAWLDVEYKIERIAGFDRLPSLEFVHLDHNLISRVDGQELPAKLDSLDLRHNLIKNIYGLLEMPLLSEIDLRENQIGTTVRFEKLKRRENAWYCGDHQIVVKQGAKTIARNLDVIDKYQNPVEPIVDPVQIVVDQVRPVQKRSAVEKKAALHAISSSDAKIIATSQKKLASTTNKASSVRGKKKLPTRATDEATVINRAILKDYIERQRKEGIKELHFIKIKNELNIISQGKSGRLYRLLQKLVEDRILVKKGSLYIIV